MINYNFEGKNVIITGGAMGLGKALANAFAKAKANVVIADINTKEANKTKEELEKYGTKVLVYQLDVTKYEQFEGLVKFTMENLKTIDILINNAGICSLQSLDEMNIDRIDKIISTNINGTLYGCKAVLPIMKKNKYGKIVNFSSIAAKLGSANCSVYAATKAAVLELTACLAREYATENININCVLPGIIRTPLWEEMLNKMTDGDDSKKNHTFELFTNSIPMKRPQEPEDIANAVLFLCTDQANNITAQNLAIDGGQTY